VGHEGLIGQGFMGGAYRGGATMANGGISLVTTVFIGGEGLIVVGADSGGLLLH
jgi:hypothetical protein